MQISKRQLLKYAGLIAAGRALNAAGLPDPAHDPSAARKLKVLVTGGHPGDPECGCGGTIARYTSLGHDVAVLYLNRGEGYCGGHPLESCGAIRTAEAMEACRLLSARPLFAGQVDGHSVVDTQHAEEFHKLYQAEKPDVVFAQWPIDRHPDHRALSSLVLDAWLRSEQSSALFYYEVGEDTMAFTPNAYVDIARVETVKRSAFYAHASQTPERWYQLQTQLSTFRGVESGYTQAEAFARHPQSRSNASLP